MWLVPVSDYMCLKSWVLSVTDVGSINITLCTSLLFLTAQYLFIIRLCTFKIALKFTLLKQHIKMIVLF